MDVVTKQTLEEVLSALPQNHYQPIDDDFIERYAEQIETIKSGYADKGGVHVLKTDDTDSVLVRVPSAEILRKVRKRADTLTDPIEQDLYLLGECLLYPDISVVRDWVSSGAPGLASTFGRKLLELSKASVEAEAKKL